MTEQRKAICRIVKCEEGLIFVNKKLWLWIGIGVITVLVILFLLGWWFVSTFKIEPRYKDKAVVVAADGTEFSVFRQEDNFPDQEITIIVTQDGKDAYVNYGFSNYVSYYDYQNDFVDNFDVIVEEYHTEEIDGYEFHWGIVYSLDNGETFTGVPKHEYETTAKQNSDFRVLYNSMVA